MTNRQKEELAKYCFDISKLSIGSLVFGLFTSAFTLIQILFAAVGLTFGAFFFILGFRLFKEVK